MGAPLYEIAKEYAEAAKRLESMELDEQTIKDTLDSMTGDFDTKVIAVANFYKSEMATNSLIDAEIERLTARKKAHASKAKQMSDYLYAMMNMTKINEVKTPLLTVKIQNNPLSVVISAEALIPAEYMRTYEAVTPPPSPDKAAIKAAIEGGAEVAGAYLDRTTKLVIK